MLSPSYLDSVADPLQKIYSDLQTAIQQDIARRIRLSGEITSATEWQIIKLRQMGLSRVEIEKAIAKALRLSEVEVVRI
ncbi:MAG: phage minor capsid protein, partial [Bacillota bacterium]